MYTNSPNEVDMTMTDSLVEPAKHIHMQSSTASMSPTYPCHSHQTLSLL